MRRGLHFILKEMQNFYPNAVIRIVAGGDKLQDFEIEVIKDEKSFRVRLYEWYMENGKCNE